MPLIAPDVLTAARGLSAGAGGTLAAVGVLVWAAGWRWHRFWVVFGITLAAGLVGLGAGSAGGGQQVMVVGVLVAVSAGLLALELAKMLAFLTGGAAAWVAIQSLVPQATELWAVFLSGGLVGVVLYRLWTMAVTSFIGTLVAGHAGLLLAADAFAFDAAAWASGHAAEANGAVLAAAVLGVVVQAKTAVTPEEAARDQVPTEDPLAGSPVPAPVVMMVPPTPPPGPSRWGWRRAG